MTPEQTKTADKFKSVKAALDRATAGPKRDRILRHYLAAEKAQAAENEAEANRELDAASQVLA